MYSSLDKHWQEIEKISHQMRNLARRLAKQNEKQASELSEEEFTRQSWQEIADLDLKRKTCLASFFNHSLSSIEANTLRNKINSVMNSHQEVVSICLQMQHDIRHNLSQLENQQRAAIAYDAIQTS